MEDYKNRNTIERKLKEAFKQDRARIQIGEISSFGLLELSRQRLRLSVSETSTDVCNFCGGVGRVQSFEVTSMQMLREAEENIINIPKNEVHISIHSNLSTYILNNKKQNVFDIEKRHKVKIIFNVDNNLAVSDYKFDSNEDEKTADLKSENQHKDKIPKKKKNQKTSSDDNIVTGIDTVLNKKQDPSLKEKKLKRARRKEKPSKEKNNSQNENFEKDIETIETTTDNVANLNKLLESKKNNPKKRKTRKTQSSAKIDVVNLNSTKNKVKTKKTGWWNN